MTDNQPATAHEISVEKVTRTSVARQRYFGAQGWHWDFWGNATYTVNRPNDLLDNLSV